MELKMFQKTAVKHLFEAMDTSARDIILKSPTGSGKTIIHAECKFFNKKSVQIVEADSHISD